MMKITPVYVLSLIIEEKAKSIDDLENHFSNIFQTSYILGPIIDRLVSAGLIVKNKRSLSPLPNIEKIQNALNINFSDLKRYSSGSITVNPIFEKPKDIKRHDLFVLMPFTDKLRPVYDDHIKKVAEKLSLTVVRADDFFTAHTIVRDIWSGIYNSEIIVADCTGRNPNVFYEIGIAHTIGRPTILISQELEDVPFDLRHLRCITYEYTPRGMEKFNEILFKTIEAIKSDECI